MAGTSKGGFAADLKEQNARLEDTMVFCSTKILQSPIPRMSAQNKAGEGRRLGNCQTEIGRAHV